MDALRLCSPVIAAAFVGAVLSAPAVFAGSSDAGHPGGSRCVDMGNPSAPAPSGDACLGTHVAAERGARPQ
jgi:hypothetical protein